MRGFIPESPLSLISKSRKEDARKVLALFHDEKMIELAMD